MSKVLPHMQAPNICTFCACCLNFVTTATMVSCNKIFKNGIQLSDYENTLFDTKFLKIFIIKVQLLSFDMATKTP